MPASTQFELRIRDEASGIQRAVSMPNALFYLTNLPERGMDVSTNQNGTYPVSE
jgi:hypothetical protein